jgi:hypothetical protein
VLENRAPFTSPPKPLFSVSVLLSGNGEMGGNQSKNTLLDVWFKKEFNGDYGVNS